MMRLRMAPSPRVKGEGMTKPSRSLSATLDPAAERPQKLAMLRT